jgi:hypothetical protein
MNARRVDERNSIAADWMLLRVGGELGEPVRSYIARLIAIKDLSAELLPR